MWVWLVKCGEKYVGAVGAWVKWEDKECGCRVKYVDELCG